MALAEEGIKDSIQMRQRARGCDLGGAGYTTYIQQNVFLRVILTKWHFLTYFLTFYLAFTFFNTGWHSIVHVISYFLTFHLAFYLVYYLRRFFVVEVRRGGEHSDPELAVEVRRGTLWSWACGGGPAGTLWSGACGGGPAGNTLIQRLLMGSGGEQAIWSLQLRSGGGRRRKAGWLT